MHVYLLFKDREKDDSKGYLSQEDVINDLNIEVILGFADTRAGQTEPDPIIKEQFKNVLVRPLKTRAEVLYRQGVVAQALDCKNEVLSLYDMTRGACESLDRFSEAAKKAGDPSSKGAILPRMQYLKEMTNRLSTLRMSLSDIRSRFAAGNGFTDFIDRFSNEYGEVFDSGLNYAVQNLEFYNTNGSYTISSGLGPGCKLSDLKVEAFSPLSQEEAKERQKESKWYSSFFSKTSADTTKMRDDVVLDEVDKLKDSVAVAILDHYSDFVEEQLTFFHNLRDQLAFLAGCCILGANFDSSSLITCMPHIVSVDPIDKDTAPAEGSSYGGAPDRIDGLPTKIEAIALYDPTLALRTKKMPVSNDIPATPNSMFIVTGANQGGKSTFLRSLGLAHLMADCGIFVAATDFSCCLYEQMFTHFARREDAAMNSGRLEDELKRMSFIIDNITRKSIVLLNESFATTTEKEGSAIARDLTGALYANGMTVFMVTHLLQFANEIYAKRPKRISFYRADRREDGARTYKILPGRPLDTSFGLDLYDDMLEKYKAEKNATRSLTGNYGGNAGMGMGLGGMQSGYGAPMGGFGAPGMGMPPQGGYGAPGMGMPPQGGFGAPGMGMPPQGGFGAPGMGMPGQGAPAQGGFGAPNGGFGGGFGNNGGYPGQ